MVKKEIQQKSADKHWLSQMVANKTDQQLVTMYEEVCIFRKTGVIPKECQTLRDLAREIQAVTKADNIQLRMAEDALLYEMSRRYYNSLYIEEKFDFPIEDDIAEEVSKMTNEVKSPMDLGPKRRLKQPSDGLKPKDALKKRRKTKLCLRGFWKSSALTRLSSL